MPRRPILAAAFFLTALWAATATLAVTPGSPADGAQETTGFVVHSFHSEYQSGETSVRILLPDKLDQQRRYPVLYVLPVEAGSETRWGDGLAEVQKLGLANRFGLICAAPTFSHLPWYADHPTDRVIRQESYLLKTVVPWIDAHYPTLPKPEGRLLLGFSKSGWGAFCMLLRHPDTFGKAVAWDAPLMMDRPGLYGSGPIFGTEENFAQYEVAALLRKQAAQFNQQNRLIHFGYGNFREHHQSAHRLMAELGIPHVYRDGPEREHSWHSGWLPEAVEMLMADRQLDSESNGRETGTDP